MHFAPGDVERAVQLLLSGVGRTEAEPGCRECVVARDAAEAAHLRYSEAWDTEGAFLRHLNSEEFRRVLVAMDLCDEEPQVVVGNLLGRQGIGFLQQLRDQMGAGPRLEDTAQQEE